ncbi:restriction endonuclease subunit S [Shewanella algae]|uniref:restriction endonuclease subunit S n=1 Tax=Shewanella algae TaxID=38313 RepID=UPI0031F54A4E
MSFDLPKGWTSQSIENAMEAIIDYRGKTPKKSDSGIPLITAKIVKSGRLETPTEFIPEEDYDAWMVRGLPQAGDVVLTTEAPLGEVAQLDDANVALAQRIVTLRGKPDLLVNDYLKYLLQSHAVQQQLDARGSGSTVKGIKQSELRKVVLSLPPIAQQRSIAGTLKSLDDKITLNTQTNQTLEQMAQALFKSWFVDFDPVIDNALDSGFFEREFVGEGIPEPLAKRVAIRQALREAAGADTDASAIGRLPPETRALFPDRFEKHPELGWIPKGWEVKPVSEALDINPKVKLSKGTTAKFADMKAAPTSGYMIDGVIEKEFSGGSKFMADDVLLARITPCLENGKTAIVDFLAQDEAGFGSTEFIVMRGKGAVSMPFVACLSRLPEFRAHCIQSMVGSSGRQRVQNACFDSFYLTFPPTADVLEKFEQTCLPSFRQMTVARLESEALANLRDTLLPKLLSGELELANTEIIVEAFA